jgi:hypothetical protein
MNRLAPYVFALALLVALVLLTGGCGGGGY